MHFSERIKAMQSSPIRRLIPYSDEAKAKGKKVYHLNIGQPDIKTPPAFLDSIRNFKQEVIEYAASQGDNELRDAMSRYYQDWNIDMLRENILVTNGGSEALWFTFMAICDHGDNVLVPEPYYANYNAFAQAANVSVTPILTKAEDGFHLPPAQEIEKLITPQTRAIVVSNPGNPTGTVYTEAEVEMLADLAKKHDLYIISDEVYREFVYDGLKLTSFGHMKHIADRVVIVDSVSKRYSDSFFHISCHLLSTEADSYCDM
jgi:aspartate aminotransferase